MMKKLKVWGTLVLIVAVVLGGLYGWWALDLRWRPKTIVKHQAEITNILEGSGWVSPGGSGPKLYMVSFRSCPECIRYQTEELPKLQEAGVDTRVIMVARADVNGAQKSTAAERATVAELWVNRKWSLLQSWMAMTPQAWTAPGIAPADGDMARGSVVEASRSTVEKLTPLLKDNGLDFDYPLLVWWSTDGEMHACACQAPQTYRKVRKELGV